MPSVGQWFVVPKACRDLSRHAVQLWCQQFMGHDSEGDTCPGSVSWWQTGEKQRGDESGLHGGSVPSSWPLLPR